MSKIPEDYIEKTYAGWLGKIIGVRHGAEIENWSYDKIKKKFGKIESYLYNYKNFAADDDINGPVFFQRVLEDFDLVNIGYEEMGLTWLNYIPDEHGFFWWGGYGVSTEHTAYLNLKNGIKPPRSGSSLQNGKILSEEIGGQIFSDCWGLLFPLNPKKAAEYAKKMSGVSHDENGKFGAQFIASCISLAFEEPKIDSLINESLNILPQESEYYKMGKDLIRFHKRNLDDWRYCFKYVKKQYGYKNYPGNVPIIPNSAIVILSLLYSRGDFSKGINIANMCGWDTDCNVGNVGTILGVLNGPFGIEKKWVSPINDFVCNSSLIGSLNIMDIPTLASYTANLTYQINDETPALRWENIFSYPDRYFHFEYPNSTHNFRFLDNGKMDYNITNSTLQSKKGKRSLKVKIGQIKKGKSYKIYHKTYYSPDDFNDSRYDPAFSPIFYSGQTIEADILIDEEKGREIKAKLFIFDDRNNKYYYNEGKVLTPGKWETLTFKVPKLKNARIEKVGIELIPLSLNDKDCIRVFIDEVKFKGKPNYTISFNNNMTEKWNIQHKEISQFTYLRGYWSIIDNMLNGSGYGEPAEIYTGNINWKNYVFTAQLIPKTGNYHNINFRVQGGIRSYAFGLAPNNKVKLYKKFLDYKSIAEENFDWDFDKVYELKIKVVNNKIQVFLDNKFLIKFEDQNKPYLNGQIGFSNLNGSRTLYKNFSVKGI